MKIERLWSKGDAVTGRGNDVQAGPKPRRTPTAAAAPKSTTVYVGKIAPTVDDGMVQRLLEACGPVKNWKRMTDPQTNEPKVC